jgi:tetratricopeptide (TPR) repeat protein
MPLFSRGEWLYLAALVIAVLLAYQPAWHGGFIWDDDAHVTKPELRSWQGLYRIWFDVRATTQYYPLLHTAFWIEHRLWGDATLGYHLVNLLLHATAAIMVALALRWLAVPGALFAATIFALHPVHVESVAWMTEQKNTLSAVFYLGAMLLYLHFDRTRKTSLYLWALGLFLLAILSKTVTATLPGALLVIFWWQRGRLSCKGDVLPLLPFFLLGAGGGMVTAWWELQVNHCVGPEFQFTPVERLLIASRAVWFHLWKLCWPTRLTFIYPRWQIDSGAWWQYLFLVGLALLLAGLWSIRRRARAPLAALLFFGGTLFPVLGFFNLYTFRYSLIANHYQYLASLGAITIAAAGAALLLDRWQPWPRWAGYALCLALLATLAGLTWRQSRMYSDHETLYRTIIDENPECWMAHNNLGSLLVNFGRMDEAIAQYRQALEIRPAYPKAHNNLGMALARQGHVDQAITHYQQALKLDPDFAEAHNSLGAAFSSQGKINEAIAHYQQALKIKPNLVEACYNLGVAFSSQGKIDEAIARFQQALDIKPDLVEACYNLGVMFGRRGKVDEAIAHYRQTLKIKPDYMEAYGSLGDAFAFRGNFDEAIRQYQTVLRSNPHDALGHIRLGRVLNRQGKPQEAEVHFREALQRPSPPVEAHSGLATALHQQGKTEEALHYYQESLRLRPDQPDMLNNLARIRATHPDPKYRDGAQAVAGARRAIELSRREVHTMDTLAAAYAEARRFPEALATARKALELARQQNNRALTDALRARLALYEAGKPYREAPSSSVVLP